MARGLLRRRLRPRRKLRRRLQPKRRQPRRQRRLRRRKPQLKNQLLLRLLRPRKRTVNFKKADEKSHREAFAARTVRDRVRVSDFESAFLQVLAIIED